MTRFDAQGGEQPCAREQLIARDRTITIDDHETQVRLRPADLAGMAHDPRGRCYVAHDWLLYGAPSGRLFGTQSWGRPNLEQVRELEAVADAVLAPRHPPFAMLIDVQQVDGIDAAGVVSLGTYGIRRHAELARSVSRIAILRPRGLTGVVAEGFFRVFTSPCPTAVFDNAAEALAWLHLTDERHVVDAVPAFRATIHGTSPLVLQLRAILEASPDTATPAIAARLLGISVRTLERRLHDAGVRFTRELLEARVRLAQRRMRDTAVKLTALALDLGFASPQHFSNAFRAVTGESPTAWRRR
ncbi:MAG TPA: AraC family transcriptional regulator [Kofleriaceae bacterium]